MSSAAVLVSNPQQKCRKSQPPIFSQHGVFWFWTGRPKQKRNTCMHGIFFHWPFVIGQLSRPLEDSWSLRPRYLSTPKKKEPLEPPKATNLHLFWTSVFSVSFRHFMSFHVLPWYFIQACDRENLRPPRGHYPLHLHRAPLRHSHWWCLENRFIWANILSLRSLLAWKK